FLDRLEAPIHGVQVRPPLLGLLFLQLLANPGVKLATERPEGGAEGDPQRSLVVGMLARLPRLPVVVRSFQTHFAFGALLAAEGFDLADGRSKGRLVAKQKGDTFLVAQVL